MLDTVYFMIGAHSMCLFTFYESLPTAYTVSPVRMVGKNALSPFCLIGLHSVHYVALLVFDCILLKMGRAFDSWYKICSCFRRMEQKWFVFDKLELGANKTYDKLSV